MAVDVTVTFSPAPSGGGVVAWGGITGILSAQTDLQSALNGKAATAHLHQANEIEQLVPLITQQIANAGKQNNIQFQLNGGGLSATGGITQLNFAGTGITFSGSGSQATLTFAGSGGTAWGGITGVLAAQTDLQTELNARQAANGELDSISAFSSGSTAGFLKRLGVSTYTLTTPAIADVTGLQAALDAKAATTHTHTIANVTGLQAALDAKLDDSQASVFGLSLLDDADAATARTTLGLGTAATAASTAFAAAAHTHTAANITDFNTAADARADARIAAASVNALADVLITSATTGQVLKFNGTNWVNDTDISGSGSPAWGSITGTLANQTDLISALNGKVDFSSFTTFGLSLVDDVDAATARATLGLGTAATSASTAFAAAAHTHTLANVTDVTITAANLNALDDAADTALHFHSADRARANHTGTQTAATISDFTEAAQDAAGNMVDATLVYNDATPALGRAAITGHITIAAGSNAAALGSFTIAQLNAAVSDADLSVTGHAHVAANITDFNTAADTRADARIAAAVINALSDVVITAPATGQVLKFNGTNWVNDTDATGGGGGGQSAIQLQEEGTNLGASGTVDTINVTGDNLVASRAGNVVTLAGKRYKREARAVPIANSTTLSTLGLQITASGTATAATPAITNVNTQNVKIEYLVTVAATTAIAAFRQATNTLWRGNAAGLGGFRSRIRWGNATGGTVATTRAFAGLTALTTAPSDVEPSTLVSMIGMGWDAADANIQLMHNDAAGVATKIDLGASFPVPTTDRSVVYEIELSCLPNATSIEYKITNVGNGAVAQGSIISADIPANNILLSARGWISVGGTSSVIGIALMDLLLESDY
jgi:hypothetical protein